MLATFHVTSGLPIIPPGSPVCPTIKAVDESIEKRKIFFSVYSSSGYNFSNEFIRIYKGHLSWNTAKKDFRAILRRCLLSVESAMSNADADKFSEFILRVSLWECRLSIETSRATLSARFPDLKAKVETSLSFREVETMSLFSPPLLNTDRLPLIFYPRMYYAFDPPTGEGVRR